MPEVTNIQFGPSDGQMLGDHTGASLTPLDQSGTVQGGHILSNVPGAGAGAGADTAGSGIEAGTGSIGTNVVFAHTRKRSIDAAAAADEKWSPTGSGVGDSPVQSGAGEQGGGGAGTGGQSQAQAKGSKKAKR